MITVGAIIFVLIVTGVAYVINVSKNSDDNKVDIHLADSGIKTTHIETDGTEGGRVASTVEIQLDDCAVAVGTIFKAVAIVTPADTERSTVWTSSDSNIVDVDAEGIITVKGVGVSVITATVGTVSDSVAIEGIQNASTGSQNGFGVYVADSLVSDKYGDLWVNHTSFNNNDNNQENILKHNNDNQTSHFNDGSNNDGSNNDSSNNDVDDNNASHNDEYQDTPTDNGNSGSNSDDDNNMSNDNTQNDDVSNNGGGDGGHTEGKLDTQGFSQVMSNVYVYQEDDTYYGEIVTQPNVTIVYIKKRGSNFDSQVLGVLSSLIPSSYEQVWNNYLTANTDKTFMIDDRKVRIVVAPNGGHSQIVIYN